MNFGALMIITFWSNCSFNLARRFHRKFISRLDSDCWSFFMHSLRKLNFTICQLLSSNRAAFDVKVLPKLLSHFFYCFQFFFFGCGAKRSMSRVEKLEISSTMEVLESVVKRCWYGFSLPIFRLAMLFTLKFHENLGQIISSTHTGEPKTKASEEFEFLIVALLCAKFPDIPSLFALLFGDQN